MKRLFVLLALAAGFTANASAESPAGGTIVARAIAITEAATPGTPCGGRGYISTDAAGNVLSCGADGKWAAPAATVADPLHFCYYDGKPYSEGATVAGKTCGYPRPSTGVLVFSPNEAQASKNLVWQ
jgi:hypothetical protein